MDNDGNSGVFEDGNLNWLPLAVPIDLRTGGNGNANVGGLNVTSDG